MVPEEGLEPSQGYPYRDFHHLEYVSRHLADQLGATPQFRADGNYDLRELLPSVLKRMKDLYGKAADAAQSWGDTAAKETAAKRKTALSTSNAAKDAEPGAVNKAVHYNEWANFGRKDFEPVVAAFKELLTCFSCETCESWLPGGHLSSGFRPIS